MIYSGNLTNRELLRNAMPLFGLSRKQWNCVIEFAEEQKYSGDNCCLSEALAIMIGNQSKIEVMEQYNMYQYDALDNLVKEEYLDSLVLI